MLSSDLFARWDFDGNLNDSSGQENDGLKYGDPATWIEGVYGQGIDLSNGQTVGFTENKITDGHNTFTFSFWINPQEYLPGSANNNIVFGKRADGLPYYGFRMVINGTTKKIQFWSTQSGGTLVLYSSADFEIGDWHHVLVTYDGITGTMYVDGEKEAEDTGVYISPEACVSNCYVCLNGCMGGTTYSKSYFDGFRWYNNFIPE